MKSFIIFLFVAGLLHFVLHLPVLFALFAMVLLWAVWKLRYIILAILGLEMLLSRRDDDA